MRLNLGQATSGTASLVAWYSQFRTVRTIRPRIASFLEYQCSMRLQWPGYQLPVHWYSGTRLPVPYTWAIYWVSGAVLAPFSPVSYY